jgi:hypothetical protein
MLAADIVSLRSVRQSEPEHPVKGEGAVEIAHAGCRYDRPVRL